MSAACRPLHRPLRVPAAVALPVLGRDGVLPLMLLLTGWASLLLGPLLLALRDSGPVALLGLAGLGPLDLIALCVAVEALWRGAREGDLRAPAWAGVGFALLLLVPSGLVAAAGLAAYGAVVAWQSRGAARWGAIGLAGLGAIHLALTLGRELRGAVIGWEAMATHAVMSWFVPQVVLAGPVLRLPDGHGIAVMAGCSVLQFLPPALLALMVMRRGVLRLGETRPTLAAPLVMLGLALVGLNLARLLLLQVSPGAYAWGHGVLGANLFGLICAGLVHAAADWGRPDA